MDEVSKYRLTGAIIWLVLLVVLVPVWFGEPVDFEPEAAIPIQKTVERPLVKQVSTLSEEGSNTKTVIVLKDGATSKGAEQSEKNKTKRWIVRVMTYKDIKVANDLLGRLDGLYDVTIKTFETSGRHSVRVGPYFSKAEAEQAKQSIDKKLYTQSEVVQLN
ncbi:MAG: SPOR domain-containing protein [Thiomicrorhabdus sp.]|nr:SPOR domain-containing protein [Thiomicrorhabdus sp.]